MGEDRECPVNKDGRIRSTTTKETRQGREDGRRGIDLEYGEQEARKRGVEMIGRIARVRVSVVHEWKGREVHAGAFIASARTCAMSSSAG